MIAFSDSATKLSGETKFDLGDYWIGTKTGKALVPDGTALAYKRHARKLNTAFVDSHVESLKVDTLRLFLLLSLIGGFSLIPSGPVTAQIFKQAQTV